ncbi:MAG: hypothetical protein FWC19_05800 [Treponema sp.]|nr:hypothetical protein [Treponema sp.]MCL2272302.1 hypothetical protein [Treponema sp.]
MSKKNSRLVINILAVFSFLSCTDNGSEPPPFIVTVPISILSNTSYDFMYAGISFYFFNKSEKSIDNITASFRLFDAKTQDNPFIGSNEFEITKLTSISPGENKEIVLSLDKFIHNAPSEPYEIDFFYILKIVYADGSIWEDKYGLYSI